MKRVLIVGLGSIGVRYTEICSKLVTVYVLDQSKDKTLEISKRFNVIGLHNIEEAIQLRPEYAIIATPHTTHLEVAKRLVEIGIKVLIEKPLSHDLFGVIPFLQYADDKRVSISVVCNMRFHPAIQSIKENISLIGRPLFARLFYGNYLPDMRPNVDYRKLYCSSNEMGGGIVLDAIHEIDYITWLFGGVNSVIAHAKKISKLEINVEDYACLILNHDSGMISEIHVDYLQRTKRRGCEIVGEHGTIIWSSIGKTPEKCTVELYRSDPAQHVSLLSLSNVDIGAPYNHLVNKFIFEESGVNDVSDGWHGGMCVSIALAALMSSRENCRISVEKLR